MTKRVETRRRSFGLFRPRFVVHSLTGFPMGQGTFTARRPSTVWYVYDRAYNFEVVSQHHKEKPAREVAKRLNHGKRPKDWQGGRWDPAWKPL